MAVLAAEDKQGLVLPETMAEPELLVKDFQEEMLQKIPLAGEAAGRVLLGLRLPLLQGMVVQVLRPQFPVLASQEPVAGAVAQEFQVAAPLLLAPGVVAEEAVAMGRTTHQIPDLQILEVVVAVQVSLLRLIHL